MKLNLGCGNNKVVGDGWINVDIEPSAKPNMCFDIQELWPIGFSYVDQIVAHHVVEHLTDLKMFFRQAYRAMKPDAMLDIIVPHHRSDSFWDDPTHVRPITETMMFMLSRQFIAMCKEKGFSNTPLCTYWDVDFEVVSVENQLAEGWKDKPNAEIIEAVRSLNNVILNVRFILKAIKAKRVLQDVASTEIVITSEGAL